jgi:16S rRNA (uracil1498-N3)-methyltransferase
MVPDVLSPVTLQAWLPAAKADYRFVLSPHVDDQLPAQIPAGSSVILLIGPEGGLSDAEVAAAAAAGFQPLRLGPRVLRTETAALAALTALQCRYGDFA